MDDSPIQIVDENNKPIGNASKQQVWREGLIHQIVRVSILNETGRLLVQKRSDKVELFPGRCDNSAAGHVDAGETYEQAASRELREELGLDEFELTELGDYYVKVIDDWRCMKRFTRAYKIILPSPLPQFNLPPDEVASIEWMEIASVKALVKDHPERVTDGLEQIIDRYF